MSDSETPDEILDTETDSAETGFEPITSKRQLDKMVAAARKGDKTRIAELQAKADELDKIRQAGMSEAEKAAERIRALETELQTERHGNIRRDVATAKGVPAERITGSTREELEASADELLAFIAERVNANPAKPRLPAGSLKSGATNVDQIRDPKERAAATLRAWSSGSR